MNVLQYLIGLRPAIPTSAERPPEATSNSELRRMLQNKAIQINGETDWKFDEEIPCFVWEVIFFPKSTTWKKGKEGERDKPPRRTTLVQFNFKEMKP